MEIQNKGCRTRKMLFGKPCQWVGFIFFWLVTCPSFGQVLPKKPVTAFDYRLWGMLYSEQISEKGTWVSYAMRYETGADTLFIKRSDGKKMYSFAGSRTGTFNGEQQFACLKRNRSLQWLDLEKGKVTEIVEVEKYLFSANGKYLITLERKLEQRTICIRNIDGRLIKSILGASDYAPNHDKDVLAITYDKEGKKGIALIELGTTVEKNIVVEDAVTEFSHIVWQVRGVGFSALKTKKETEGAMVFYYDMATQKGFDFNPAEGKDFLANYFIESGYASRLTLSADGRKVFFTIRKKAGYSKSFDGVQQWNGNDAVVYPERRLIGDGEYNTRIMAWWPESGKVRLITDDKQPFGLLNGNQDFALTYSPHDLPPQYKMNRNVNYYVTDMETGQKELMLENQSTELEAFSFSPQGKYFAYFREGHWLVYDFVARKHRNVTLGKSLELSNKEDKSWTTVYSVAGWGTNDETLFISDRFDIWSITIADGKTERLTKGRETGISYTIMPSPNSTPLPTSFSGQVGEIVDKSRDVILRGSQRTKSGYFMLQPNGQMHAIAFGDYSAAGIVKADKANVFLFQKKQFSSPPELVISKGANGSLASVFKSNRQHYQYAWGKQELISYRNSKDESLQGILYYPANYNPKEKYPMVVHIYEKQSYLFHNYYSPSLYNTTGFNVANLTAQGYFVFFPDIEYELGNPGLSATDCVIAATKEVIQKGVVDPNKIGLIGNSFGGYETNFIIGKTNLFACAVSGASVADLRGWYLSIGWLAGVPEIWRFESQQWRMGKSLFKDREGYERNSPLTYADSIKTPVLLWAGEEDRQVHYYQSIAFYLALRRLQKEEILLIYPGEGHSIRMKENQKDLTHKVEDWLGYYLKGEKPKSWIVEGIP